MGVDEQRWHALCDALGISADRDEFGRLCVAYTESHRVYHTLQHLAECLNKLDWAASEIGSGNTALAEAALWYHDAVYRPGASDNELKSAAWASEFLGKTGLSASACNLVHSLILATRHDEKPRTPTHRLVVDVDLAILGAEPWRFAEYEQQIRKEFRRVPWLVYKKKRSDVIRGFLQTPRIYNTELFFGRFEMQARKNLDRSLLQLRTGASLDTPG